MPWRNWVCFFVKFIHQGAFIKQLGLKYDLSKKTVRARKNKLSFSQTLSSPLSPQLFLEQRRTLRCWQSMGTSTSPMWHRKYQRSSGRLQRYDTAYADLFTSLYFTSSKSSTFFSSPFLRCDLRPQTNYAFLHCVWAGVGRWRDNLRRAKDKLDQSRLLCPGCGHSIAILSISVVSARTQSPPPSAFSCTRRESTALVERVLESRNAPRLHDYLCSC